MNSNQTTTLLKKHDSYIYKILMLQAPLLFISGFFGAKMQMFSTIAAIIILVLVQLSYSLLKGTELFAIVGAVIMMTVSALLIQSQMGMIEMHFHIFASIVVFLIYQDWKPIIAALLTTAVYHVGFMYLQMQGAQIGDMPIMAFEGHHTMWIMIVHCIFAICQSGLLIYMASLMKGESSSNQNIASAIESVSKDNDLSIRLANPKSNAEQSFNQLLDKLASIFTDYQNIANKRLFTVGLGTAPNRYFMKRAAEAGRGSYQFIGSHKQLVPEMNKLFHKLDNPQLTDIQYFNTITNN